MKAPLEKDVLKAVKQYLELAGCLVVRVNSGAMKGKHEGKQWFMRFNSEKGCSDLLACVPCLIHSDGDPRYEPVGVFLGLEVKRPGFKATPEQKAFGERLARAGGTWACVSGIPEVRDVLRQLGAKNVP